ncbi:spherulation-specific family 4 protein [Cohnella zeiphila]|uniref:Spherulation-specific family 4 n=1 Tax=Cohnella zeiphila TaxID=2761120 RepID=A0A7X0VVH3_9BACL|nr:spherulation-specific family 4 protein [Cohnella zeiphila]MBB6731347.1 hypothetical protein [Cohnella zeiphila]
MKRVIASLIAILLFILPGMNALAAGELNMKVIVPAYFDPPSSNWTRIINQAATMPGRMYAIANKNEGPGPAFDSAYNTAINSMHTNSGKVIGYANTDYGNASLASVKAIIDAWYAFYPSIDGVFLDCMEIAPGKEGYYQDLYNYIKAKSASALVVANPGITTVESYLLYNGNRVADVLCVFETNTGFDTWVPAAWTNSYDRSNFYVLPYGTTASKWQSRVDYAASHNVGWIFCTNDSGANPWDTLPSYFENFSTYVASK